jgi:hypothetical protein
MVYHDNAPAHTSLLLREFLANHEMTVILPTTPLFRFGPCTLQAEIHSERSPIADHRRDEENSLWDLHAVPQNAFQNGKKRWKRCIDSGATDSVVPSSLILVTLMKEALRSSKTSILTRVTQRNIPEDTILQVSLSCKHISIF